LHPILYIKVFDNTGGEKAPAVYKRTKPSEHVLYLAVNEKQRLFTFAFR
jgi:hypothetical protein